LVVGELEGLMKTADTNRDEVIDYQEFVKLAYDSLLSMGREKYLRALEKAAENKSRVGSHRYGMVAGWLFP